MAIFSPGQLDAPFARDKKKGAGELVSPHRNFNAGL
jgi:hypothetical protein